jgi:hypothetical protein
MQTILNRQPKENLKSLLYNPCVSLILPFEPIMSSKNVIISLLSNAFDKVETEIIENYDGETAGIVLQKLKRIIEKLNFSSHKKAIAIYVSPVFEKVIYLAIPVRVGIYLDNYFSIRNIIYNKQKNTDYNVMLLSKNACTIYACNNKLFERIIYNNSCSFNDDSKTITPLHNIETSPATFLHHVDCSLNRILIDYPVPLFVVGAEEVITQFKNISENNLSVNEFIVGNYEGVSKDELQQLLEPFLHDWAVVKKQFLLNKLKKAAQTNNLIFGIRDVWEQCMKRNGKLLLIQNNYRYAPEPGSSEEIINNVTQPYSNFSYIKDAVDAAIEKILENGGDVEFVDADFLKDIGPIALIK